jgi:hypothetical protein
MELKDLQEATTFAAESRGISIQATSPTDYVLSIQAGEGLYSSPRRRADFYTQVEFAIWKTYDTDGIRSGPYIKDGRISNDRDQVYGFETFETLLRAIELIETWVPGNEPKISIHRKNAPYRDLN